MPVDYSKLLDHPDKDEIISKLVSGIKVKDIVDWLKIKYPNKEQSHLRLSNKLLKEFLDKNLDVYKTLEQDALAIKKGEKQEKKISASLRNNKTYQERLAEIATNEVDITKMMVELHTLIQARIEQFFDRIQENPSILKNDYALIKYFELMLNYVEKYDKIVNKSPDQIVQHNITVQVLDKYVAVLQNCIRDTLSKIDAEAAFLFMEVFTEELSKLELPEEAKALSQDKRLVEAKILSESINPNEFEFPEVKDE